MDVFTIASIVLLARAPPRSPAEWLDKLWAKLARQWALMAFPWELFGSFCTRASSCMEGWPFGAVLRRHTLSGTLLFEDCLWYVRVDFWTHLACSTLLLIKFRFGAPAFWSATIALAGCALHQAIVREPWHYNLVTYRLPMALLVLSVTQSQGISVAMDRLPKYYGRVVVGTLICLGWAFCPRTLDPFRDECETSPKKGWAYFCEGACFHIGLTLMCLQASGVSHEAIAPWLNWLSSLSLGIVLLNGEDALYTSLVNCERGHSAPWVFLEKDGAYTEFNSQDLILRPRWVGFALRIVVGALLLLLSQLAVWTIQRPWASVLHQLPQRVSRVATAMFVALQLWRNFRTMA
mmetsp:Transcript_144581/g.463276  ORF Transcript_144581/g.463276 Transcript_144581/m.463276 type:complete len:349 (-) Transcript_144581:64-1110(-)